MEQYPRYVPHLVSARYNILSLPSIYDILNLVTLVTENIVQKYTQRATSEVRPHSPNF
jgi:hypothetical protein